MHVIDASSILNNSHTQKTVVLWRGNLQDQREFVRISYSTLLHTAGNDPRTLTTSGMLSEEGTAIQPVLKNVAIKRIRVIKQFKAWLRKYLLVYSRQLLLATSAIVNKSKLCHLSQNYLSCIIWPIFPLISLFALSIERCISADSLLMHNSLVDLKIYVSWTTLWHYAFIVIAFKLYKTFKEN